MRIEQVFEQWLKIVRSYLLFALLCNNLKEALCHSFSLEFSLPICCELRLRYFPCLSLINLCEEYVSEEQREFANISNDRTELF